MTSRWVLDQYDGPQLDYPTLGFYADTGDILIATAAPDARWSLNGNQSAAETVTRYTIGGDPSYVEPGDGHVLTYSDADNAYVPTAPVDLLDDTDLSAALTASYVVVRTSDGHTLAPGTAVVLTLDKTLAQITSSPVADIADITFEEV